MCGRTSLFAPPSDLASRFGVRVPSGYHPRYNVAPTAPLSVVTGADPETMQSFAWGFEPNRPSSGGTVLFNARAETVAEKPTFRDAWQSRPCLVLSSGYYEWRATERGADRPYRFHRADDVAFAMAGLWEPREATDGPTGAVTVLTTAANDLAVHDRMPVVLPADAEATWLTGGPDDRAALCRPYQNDDLEAYPVSTAVNDPSTDSPAVIEPDESSQTGLDEFG